MSRNIVRKVRSNLPVIDFIIEWVFLIYGLLVHLITGKTPKRSHHSLVMLFAKTQGKINDFLSSILSIVYPPYEIREISGVLQSLSKTELDEIQHSLERDGYHVFEERLDHDFCEQILQQTLKVDCLLGGDEIAREQSRKIAKYDAGNPMAACYMVAKDDVTDIKEVQKLICDPLLIKVAQSYLKAKPIFSAVSMSWSPHVKETPDSEAAQQYHFDMERIKWLRFFVYLTDVDSDSGPHCFVKGTHRTGWIPKHILDQGYTRKSDEEIFQEFGTDSCVEFTGWRGTIIAEDSRGFHKGKMPNKGHRLLLAFELSNSTFGSYKRHMIRKIREPQFRKFYLQYPRLYRNFDFIKESTPD